MLATPLRVVDFLVRLQVRFFAAPAVPVLVAPVPPKASTAPAIPPTSSMPLLRPSIWPVECPLEL